MKQYILLIAGIFVLTSATMRAETQITSLKITGMGSSYYEAIQNGLIESLKQAEGVSIRSRREFAKSIKEKSFSSPEQGATHEVTIDKQMGQSIREATQGLIHQYRVLNAEQDEQAGQWVVQLEIQLKKYKTPGISPHRLRKFAVIPFRVKSTDFQVLDKNVSATDISSQFNQKLVTELTQSRRFTVLDREYMQEFLHERNLLLSADAAPDEQMKVGQALGVDYMLLGTITQFRAVLSQHYIKALDETITGVKADFIVDFRIMVMATRQIKWSDTVKIHAGVKELKSAYKTGGQQGVIDYLLERAARKIVHTSLDNIYPIKILKVAGKNRIYLNQGGKMTRVGDYYDIYTKGENLVDPDTGLKIKIDGEQVARLKITRVMPKYALAQFVSGDFKRIQAGAILRKSSATAHGAQQQSRRRQPRVMQPNW